MVGNVGGVGHAKGSGDADIKEQRTVFKALKGKEAGDTANEEPDHSNPVKLDLPPFALSSLQDVAHGNAQVCGGPCQVRRAHRIPRKLARETVLEARREGAEPNEPDGVVVCVFCEKGDSFHARNEE